jgi:tetratricopeptide (TPR) repeat protein
MRKLIIGLLFGATISCTPSKEKQVKEINTAIEDVNKTLAANQPDSAAIRKAETSVIKFLEDFPQDTLAPRYLFDLGLTYQKQGRYDKALGMFDRCYREYPDSKQASTSLFLQGFLYANVLSNLDKAKEKYQLYLDKYSRVNAKMTEDVQLELQNLGKSADELLREIQQKADTTQKQS